MGRYLPHVCLRHKTYELFQDPEGNQRDSWGMAPIRVTDLDVSPNMTKVVAVGVIHLPPIPHPPTSTGNSPAPGARGDSASQSPQSQSHTPSYIVKAENRMIVYDLATKHQIACVFQIYVMIAASNARLVDRSLRLDGETTSVRVSRDSRYALISHAPDVRFHPLLPMRSTDLKIAFRKCFYGI
jgi:hypothetical protein